jgi:hypothetical protein
VLDLIESILASYPPQLRANTQHLRTLVTRAVPQATETVQARHHYIAYSSSGRTHERIIYMCPVKGWMRLGFDFGGKLVDPYHRLEGDGERMRHGTVKTVEDARHPALEGLILSAWAAGTVALPQRKARRWSPGHP